MAPVCGPAAEILGIFVLIVFSAGGLAGVGFTFFYTPYCMAWVYDSAMNKLESDYQSSGFIQKVLQAYGDSGPDQPSSQEVLFSIQWMKLNHRNA
ncbi:hypothetical protein GCM10023116_17470 [Kistimonas scapharcae]|uniref:Uncharacterized protein n=2 Tax=Kistimonas scapharcae TaxID=1036133 RepID=A0ABP8UZT8_9GAMM